MKWKKAVLRFAVKTLNKYLVDKIKYAPLRDFVKQLTDKIEQIVKIMTDKEPNNEKQFKELWEAEKGNLFDSSLEIAATIVRDKVDDEELALMISDMLLGLMEEEEEIEVA